jgi:hypothetical protein
MIAPDLYKAGCALVMGATSREAAFDDYASLIAAYRANGFARIDGAKRDDLEYRVEMDVSPFESSGGYLAHALRCASIAGLTLDHLIDLFEQTEPDSGEQALCIVEDALCILAAIERVE